METTRFDSVITLYIYTWKFSISVQTLNRGLVGSNVFVCYKKSMLRPETLCYEGQILTRFPPTDHPGFPLPAQVPLFCLPLGSVIESWPVKAEPSAPVFSRLDSAKRT